MAGRFESIGTPSAQSRRGPRGGKRRLRCGSLHSTNLTSQTGAFAAEAQAFGAALSLS